MSKLHKLRKRGEKLAYRVQILEQQQRLAELREREPIGFHNKTKGETDGWKAK